jgi:hypothetical protein
MAKIDNFDNFVKNRESVVDKNSREFESTLIGWDNKSLDLVNNLQQFHFSNGIEYFWEKTQQGVRIFFIKDIDITGNIIYKFYIENDFGLHQIITFDSLNDSFIGNPLPISLSKKYKNIDSNTALSVCLEMSKLVISDDESISMQDIKDILSDLTDSLLSIPIWNYGYLHSLDTKFGKIHHPNPTNINDFYYVERIPQSENSIYGFLIKYYNIKNSFEIDTNILDDISNIINSLGFELIDLGFSEPLHTPPFEKNKYLFIKVGEINKPAPKLNSPVNFFKKIFKTKK